MSWGFQALGFSAMREAREYVFRSSNFYFTWSLVGIVQFSRLSTNEGQAIFFSLGLCRVCKMKIAGDWSRATKKKKGKSCGQTLLRSRQKIVPEGSLLRFNFFRGLRCRSRTLRSLIALFPRSLTASKKKKKERNYCAQTNWREEFRHMSSVRTRT